MKKLIRLVNDSSKAEHMTALLAFPFLRHIVPDLIGYTEQVNVTKETHKLVTEMVEEHKATLNEDSPSRDLIDEYLKKIKTDGGEFNEEELALIIVDLFVAGSDTTSTAMNWIIRYLIEYPEIQRKVHEELDQVLGNAAPTLKDKGQVPYTEAMILETLRHGGGPPYAIPHRAMADIKYKGILLCKLVSL